ncbi:MAG: ammonia-forming cytochrome c nitrite reductase subunit c552 [Coriobacteriia bacterium]|nr:ammonia-forming cytochrome c nitrite reductase subunit c552 [Coriobacteriia bacterium]
MLKRKGMALVSSAIAASMIALACGSVVAVASDDSKAADVAASQSSKASSTFEGATPGTTISMNEWKVAHPDEYASFATTGWDVDANKRAGHYNMLSNMLLLDHADLSCVSCKTTAYNDLSQKYEAGTPLRDMAGDIESFWDCTVCHEDPESLELRVGLASFNPKWEKLAANEDDIPLETLLCGQCHRAYTDGLGVEVNHGERLVEKGKFDEAKGVTTASAGHPDIEVFYQSTHADLGLTCVDCHMPTVINETGAEFTSHNSSGSVLESVDALETCLSCHSAQGVEDAAGMRDFVLQAQKELSDAGAQAQSRIDELGALLEEATAAGTESEELDQARDLYSRASFDLSYVGGSKAIGIKVAHDPVELHELVAEAEGLAQQGIDLLA